MNIAELLIKNNKTITFAESCTGGLIAKKLTDIAGASECFECSFVTYSNEKKAKLIGVSKETLEKYGAVSYQTALEMCRGARDTAEADIAISVTGIAGPGGGTAEKPVGLVYVGICAENIWAYTKLNLSGAREKIREDTADIALSIAEHYLLGNLEIEGNKIKNIF